MFDNQRILVTGGTGSLGKALRLRAKEENWNCEFVMFSRDETKQSIMRSLYPEDTYILGDVAKYRDVKRAMQDIDIVFHFAAYKQVPAAQNNVPATIETNILGSQNIVDVAIEEGVLQVVASSTDKACLDWLSKVELADGTTEYISKLVKNKYDGEVVTIDPNSGEKTISKVIGWYKNKLADRKRFKIGYKYGPYWSGNMCGPIVTEDHKILTTIGWKEAKELTELDFIITSEVHPNKKQMQVFVGAVLGDGSLTKTKGNSRSALILSHASQEEEWLELKISALHEFGFSKKQYRENQITVRSQNLAFLTELREEYFYPEGKKIIPFDLLEAYFSPLLLATWFMDDGTVSQNNGGKTSPNARLGTHGYTKEEVYELAEFFIRKGFDCWAYPVTVSGKEYYEIRFSVDGTKILFDYIANYVPTSMRHKVNCNASQYKQYLWVCGAMERYTSHPIIVEQNNLGKRDVYCLDVENTHTFVSSGVVVHNCAPANMYGVSKSAMESIFQDANKFGHTTFHLARYGNVISSNASVIPLFKRQKESGGPLTVTDARMTRFWLSLDQAVDLILLALKKDPGVIVVPKAPVMSIYALADAIGEGLSIKEIGIRPGEKIHESMVSLAESIHTTEDENHYYIYPPTSHMVYNNKLFTYSSDDPVYILSAQEIINMIESTQERFGV